MRQPSDCVEFLQRLIQTESMSGEEGAIATLVAEEMTRLGYEEVRIDEAGNVIGVIRGRGEAPSVMFNTHLDHVDVGDPTAWPHPPFGGEIADGRVWGRGAVDIKGPLAAQVYGIARLKDAGPPPGDVYVTGVVQEEVGGLGARYLAERLRTDLVLIGEPQQQPASAGTPGPSRADRARDGPQRARQCAAAWRQSADDGRPVSGRSPGYRVAGRSRPGCGNDSSYAHPIGSAQRQRDPG